MDKVKLLLQNLFKEFEDVKLSEDKQLSENKTSDLLIFMNPDASQTIAWP